MSRRHVVLVSYGEPPVPDFGGQFAYSFRILLNLTRIIAAIPAPLLPLIALARARSRRKTWRARGYGSPLETITQAQAACVRARLQETAGTGWTAHVAYEFRNPQLETVLRAIPADEAVFVVPMYAADSAFTHALSRQTAMRVNGSRRTPARVLEAIDAGLLAAISAEHVRKQVSGGGSEAGSWALVLAAHGTLLEPSKPIETGRENTERLCRLLEERLAPEFGMVIHGWLNHTRGGRWTEPAMDQALRQVFDAGYRKTVYFPYGFLADNAETQIEGPAIAGGLPGLDVRFLPCLNDSAALADAIAAQIQAISPAP